MTSSATQPPHVYTANVTAKPPPSRCLPSHQIVKKTIRLLIISTLYLPETIVSIRYQCELLRSLCAGHTNYSAMTGTVR
jgi:hypothetical protein